MDAKLEQVLHISSTGSLDTRQTRKRVDRVVGVYRSAMCWTLLQSITFTVGDKKKEKKKGWGAEKENE